MTKYYKIFSRTYRITLALFFVFFLSMSSLFSGLSEGDDNSDTWLIIFSGLTLTTITVFHKLNNDDKYKIFVQFLVCILVVLSLAFLLFLVFSIIENGDANLLIKSIILISIVINVGLLFFLIQDKKYNHNG